MHTIKDGFYIIRADLEDSKLWNDEEQIIKRGIKYEREVYERCILEDVEKLEELRAEIIANRGILTEKIVKLMTELIRYNNLFRGGYKAFKDEIKTPSKKTIENILKMANRSATFLKRYGEVKCGLYFRRGGFKNTKHVKWGDGDFWSGDVFFDMKVKKDGSVRADDIKQQVIYYLLSVDDGYEFNKCIMFNPRYGSYFEFNVKDIPDGIIKDIKEKW